MLFVGRLTYILFYFFLWLLAFKKHGSFCFVLFKFSLVSLYINKLISSKHIFYLFLHTQKIFFTSLRNVTYKISLWNLFYIASSITSFPGRGKRNVEGWLLSKREVLSPSCLLMLPSIANSLATPSSSKVFSQEVSGVSKGEKAHLFHCTLLLHFSCVLSIQRSPLWKQLISPYCFKGWWDPHASPRF